MKTMIASTWLALASLGVGCGSTHESADPTSPGARQTLIASGDCEFASCGVVPSDLSGAAELTCQMGQESCNWEADAADTVSAYRFCDASECPDQPTTECPTGTSLASRQCGSENDDPCAWTTTCVPPRLTTPCAAPDGCDHLPVLAIGVICQDGSNGGFACVTDGETCRWERDCD